jgi:hypothetical protein
VVLAEKHSIAVVYLARHADGSEAFRRFEASYRRHSSGIPHDLVVIYKGFAQQGSLQEARNAFRHQPHQGVELADVGFDIGSYLECAKRLKHDFVCFLNTHTEIAAPRWLAHLHSHASRNGVGVAGAMGSYESLRQSWELIQKFFWLFYVKGLPLDEHAAKYYVKFPEYLPPMRRFLHWRKLLPAPLVARSYRQALEDFEAHWEDLLQREMFRAIAAFPKFPNPHIRSNAFMLRRDHLKLFDRVTISNKDDACFFESGRNSLTAQLRRAGHAAIVVGKNGQGYDVEQWPSSGTFRLGEQENLVVTDNHGRAFQAMSAENRITHARMTWGAYLGALPAQYPTLALDFGCGSLAPASVSA